MTTPATTIPRRCPRCGSRWLEVEQEPASAGGGLAVTCLICSRVVYPGFAPSSVPPNRPGITNSLERRR